MVFTATVTGAGATGTVSFEDAGESLATVPLVKGQATYPTSSLTAGDHSIVAIYNGDDQYAASKSPGLAQIVNGVVTITTIASSANVSTWGETVTFTVHVTSASAGSTPTGTNTFLDGKVPVGLPVALVNGSAAFSAATLPVGSHSTSAVYSGDSTYADSFSPELTHTVNAAPKGTLLSSNRNPSAQGQEVIFTAGVSTPKGELRRELAGTVQLYDGDTLIGTQPYDNGGATFRTSSLTPGTHAMKSVFQSTNPNFTSNTSNTLPQTVTETGGQPALAINAAMSATLAFPQPLTLTVRNLGATEDAAVTLNGISLRTLSGSGQSTLVSPLPVLVGSLGPGESRTVTVVAQVPTTVERLELVENGSFQTGNTTYQFSEGQAVVPPASQ